MFRHLTARDLGHPRCEGVSGLEGGFASLVVADADGFVDAADEDFAVSDAAGAGRAENGLDGLVFPSSLTIISILILGSRSTVYSLPR